MMIRKQTIQPPGSPPLPLTTVSVKSKRGGKRTKGGSSSGGAPSGKSFFSSKISSANIGIVLMSVASTLFVVTLVYLLLGGDIGGNSSFADTRSFSPPRMDSSIAFLDTTSLIQELPPSIWSTRRMFPESIVDSIASQLSAAERQRAMELCGKFLYSSIHKKAISMQADHTTFVATGDLPEMWTRDSAVQVGIYMNRQAQSPFLQPILEGAIRRNAFYIEQDPYANAYNQYWKNPLTLQKKERVIGRGGWVGTRNYELDSGGYFLTQLYDYFIANHRQEHTTLSLLHEVFPSVKLLLDVWIVEQNHEEASPYRYFELSRQGKGRITGYTGMTWSGFRPSDDPCEYNYLIPSNIMAAAALERVLVMNKYVWKDADVRIKASKLLQQIEEGIRKHGIVTADDGSQIYAYEVDGLGHSLIDFDDANVPSLLSIPLLGWSGYDPQVYENTRQRLLNAQHNAYFYEGDVLRGMGSPHTPKNMVWPMALAIEALTQMSVPQYVFQIRQMLRVAECHDAMHESVSVNKGCASITRNWFEWANAMFVVLIETGLGETCDASGKEWARQHVMDPKLEVYDFYQNRYGNSPEEPLFYQGIESLVQHDTGGKDQPQEILGGERSQGRARTVQELRDEKRGGPVQTFSPKEDISRSFSEIGITAAEDGAAKQPKKQGETINAIGRLNGAKILDVGQ